MTLEDLRIFVAVCDAGSLSAVARQEGCTQPAVSQHVVRLERELGIPLLERRATGVLPTDAGRALQDAALDSLGSIAAGVRRVEEIRDGEAGSLSITTGGTTVRHFLRASVVSFRTRHPEVALEFTPASSTRRCLELLRREQADLALVTLPGPPSGIEHRRLLKMDLHLIVPADDPLARRARLGVADLRGIRHIGLTSHTHSRAHIDEALAQAGVRIATAMTVDDFDTASVFVELGLGHAIVPAVHAAHFAGTGAICSIPIDGMPPVEIGWATRRFDALSRVALAFIAIVRSELGRSPPVPGLHLA